MRPTYFIMISAAILVSGLSLGGCTPTVIQETAQAAFEDRITEDQISDLKIASGIHKRLALKDKNLLLDVGIDVWEQRVMLTGTLDGRASLDNVLALTREDERIKVLYNEIRIVPTDELNKRRELASAKGDAEKSGIEQTVNDYWIEAKIKGKLIGTRGVTSVNYRWRSVKNTVYIIGRARSSGEREQVLGIIRDTEGVKNTKHFVEVKPIS